MPFGKNFMRVSVNYWLTLVIIKKTRWFLETNVNEALAELGNHHFIIGNDSDDTPYRRDIRNLSPNLARKDNFLGEKKQKDH